jgi:TolA-binding protein
LKELRKQISDLDTEVENLLKQKQVLETLEGNLTKQLEEAK